MFFKYFAYISLRSYPIDMIMTKEILPLIRATTFIFGKFFPRSTTIGQLLLSLFKLSEIGII